MSLEKKFPTVAKALSKLKLRSTILDGEVVAVDENGIPRFQLLQRFQKQPTAPLAYYLFDLLWAEGMDVTAEPVLERRRRLTQVISQTCPKALAPDKTLNWRPYLELNLPRFGGHPREIFKLVIIHSAYRFVMVHNYPSGDPNPSEADLRLTRRTVEAGRILQLQLIDHVIIGAPAPKRNSYLSFKEAGFIG